MTVVDFAEQWERKQSDTLQALAADPAPERRLEALRYAVSIWQDTPQAFRARIAATAGEIIDGLDYFAKLEFSDFLIGLGTAPQPFVEALGRDDPALAQALRGLTSKSEAACAEGRPPRPAPSQATAPALPEKTGVAQRPDPRGASVPQPSAAAALADLTTLALEGHLAEVAGRLSIRTGRERRSIEMLLNSQDVTALGTLIRKAGEGPALVAALVSRMLGEAATASALLPAMQAWERAEPLLRAAPLSAAARAAG